MDTFLEEGKWVSHQKGFFLIFEASIDGNNPSRKAWEKNKYFYLLRRQLNPNITWQLQFNTADKWNQASWNFV